jgi:hypothetical protein
VLAPNTTALALANSTTAVGSAQLASPLLPLPLTGQVYLTECSAAGPNCAAGLGLSIRFPSPLAINLNGVINLSTNAVQFANIPDLPVSDLLVTLNGGPESAFTAICAQTSGTLAVAAVGQNGATANPSSTLNVTGCPAIGPGPTAGKPTFSAVSLSGMPSGHPKLHFKVTHGSNAPNIKSVAVTAPGGLSFHTSKVCKGKGKHKKCKISVKGLSVSGGTIKTVKASGGHLTITLKRAASSVTVTVKGPGLKETKGLTKKVKKHKVKKETVTLKATDAKGASTSKAFKLSV